MTTEDVKRTCVTCKYVSGGYEHGGMVVRPYLCTHPDLRLWNPVTGGHDMQQCERLRIGRCGLAGTYWEPT